MRRSWPAPARCGGAGSLWPTPPAGSSRPAFSRWPPTWPAAPCSGRRARSPGCSPVPPSWTSPRGREPMETELARAAAGDGITPGGDEIAVFPFDPARKLVSRACQAGDGIILAVSGAPEAVLERCTLDAAARAPVTATLARLTREGMRVIGLARRPLISVPADRDTAEAQPGVRGAGRVYRPPPRRRARRRRRALRRGGGHHRGHR